MSSSYNIPCSKRKLLVSIYSTTETSLEMSTLAVWCRVLRSLDFSAPSCNCSAACLWWNKTLRSRKEQGAIETCGNFKPLVF